MKANIYTVTDQDLEINNYSAILLFLTNLFYFLRDAKILKLEKNYDPPLYYFN